MSSTLLQRPLRLFLFAMMLTALAAPVTQANRVISREEARRAGLERAWFSQVQLDAARSHLVGFTLNGEVVVAVTSAGVVQAIDAETGATRWVTRIGNPAHPSIGPAVSNKYVALLNGSTLFVLDIETGREALSRQVGGAPGGAPGLSDTHAFVPLFSGRVEAYPLDQAGSEPWYYTSVGRVFMPVTATNEAVAWSSTRNHVYVAEPTPGGVRFRLEATSPSSVPTAIQGDRVFAATEAGHVYSFDANTGTRQWRYSAGTAVVRAPVVIDDTIYVVTNEPALHAIDVATGDPRWVAPNVLQFTAASKSRVYALAGRGQEVALDRATGAVLDRGDVSEGLTAAINQETDRLYFYSDDGLIQCLHEIGADQPLHHQPQPEEPAEEPAEAPAEQAEEQEPDTPDQPADEPADEPEDAPANNPFAPIPGGNPFGGDDAENPFGDFGGDDTNPFGS